LKTMAHTLELFQRISWNNTKFEVVSRTATELTIQFDSLSLSGEEPRKVEMVFLEPSSEWASLWSQSANEWIEHPDHKYPIGHRIEEATAKVVRKLKFSFGGHHTLGWARWGFTAESIRVNE
jgi:hypothetical protein